MVVFLLQQNQSVEWTLQTITTTATTTVMTAQEGGKRNVVEIMEVELSSK